MLLTSWLQGFWNQFTRKSNRRIKGRKTAQARRKPITGRSNVERLESRVVLDSTYHNLAAGPLVQDWSNGALITTDNDWSGVPSIEGYLGDGLSGTPGTDPQTITSGTATTLNVLANVTDPTTVTGGAVAELAIANPTIALQASDSAQAPYLLFHVDTTGRSNVTVQYVLRDVDGSATDTVQPFALQYRIGNTDPFINIPAAFVADATDTGSTLSTTVNVVLPVGANNQSQVQIRIITANASGSASDELVGIDDIQISSQPLLTLPSAAATYTENGAGVLVDSAATVSNVTSTLQGGTLVASITANGQATDVLKVSNIGTGAGQIGVSGSNVTYEGATLGTLAGGTGGTPLSITLNASATSVKVQALLQAIAYSSTSDNPSTADRTVSFVLTDGAAHASPTATQLVHVVSVNDVPSFIKGANQTVLEDAAAQTVVGWATSISTGSPDESSQVLTFNVTGNTNPGLFSVAPAIAANGTLTYTLAANANGFADITITLKDDGGTANGGVDTSAPQTFRITATAVNDAPTFTKGADQNVLEDSGAHTVTGWATAISAGPADEAGQTLSFTVISNSNAALFSVAPAISSNGTLTYTLAPDANGSASINIRLRDNGGTANGGTNLSAVQNFKINVTAVNDAPSFNKGADQTVDEDSGAHTLTGWATAISGGPANESNQILTFNVIGDTNPGLFTVAPAVSSTGTLTFTLAPNTTGFSDITITLSDNHGTANGGADTSAPQTFRIRTTGVNDAPSFTKGPNQTVLEDAAPQSVAGWATAIDAGGPEESGQTLTFNVTGNTNPGLFSAGPAIAANGTLTYTLAPNANGVADITITLSDDGGTNNGGVDTSAPQTFRITATAVNDAPSFAAGADESVLEDSGAHTLVNWATGISAGPADEASQTVTFNVTGNTNPGLFSVAPAIAPNGTLTYTLAANANGSADITVTLSDNGGTANGGVNTSAGQPFKISVTAVNDRPTFNGGPNQSVLEDAGAQTVVNWATGMSAGPGNESGQSLTFLVTNDNNGLFSAQPTLSNSGTLTYTPVANANGTATVTVVLQDDGGTANGGNNASNAYTFTITVLSVNDAPSYTPGGNQTVNEDAGAVTVAAWATNISAGPTQEAAETLTFVVTNDNNALFAVQPAIAANGDLTFTPAANLSGSTTVTVVLTDNGGTANGGINSTSAITFTITVLSVNDAPSFTKGGDESVLEDSGAHTVANWATNISTGPANESAQTVAFNVTNNNNGLFAVQPAIAADGTLTYTLADNAFGAAVVTVTLSDNGGTTNGGVDTSAAQTFNITVTGINDVPSFNSGADQTVLEDAVAQSVANWATNISAGQANESAQVLTFNVTGNTNPGLFAVGPAISASGTLTYTLAANANGFADITITLSDDGGTANGGVDTSAPQQFRITATPVNDAPTFTVGADQTVLEDATAQTVANWATNISAGPADEAGQALTFNVTGNTNPALFTVAPAIAADGTLTYTLAPDANGVAEITITLSDNGGTADGGADTSTAATFLITATAVNDAPSFAIGADQTVLEDAGPQSVANWATNISAGPTDEGSQVLTFNVTGNSNPGLFSVAPAIAADGTLTFTPAANANGSADITITLSDDGGTQNGGADTSSAVVFHINVTAVNDAPSFTIGANQNVEENAPAQSVANWATNISAGPANESAQTVAFTVTANTNPALFSVAPAVAADGTLTYTVAASAVGSAQITIVLTDNGGTANGGVDTSAPQTFFITVGAINDAPSFTKGGDETVLEDSGAHTVTNWATNISAGPADESIQTVTFNVINNTNAALFAVAPAISSTGTLTYTLAPDANGFADITITLSDDGGTLTGGVDTSAPQTFRISVTAVNDAPSFTKGANQTVLEDASAQTIVGWATGISAGPADEAGQALTFNLTGNTNLPLFSVQPAIAPDGTLTYTLAPNANGSADITFTLSDNGGTDNGGADTSAPQIFKITVTAVNDPPTFTGGANEVVLEDSGARSVANWATLITKGAANESAQTLTFLVSNDNNGLFSTQPAISPTGTLTYTPAANANGTATVSVILEDNGGTANGGNNTSTLYQFTITVTAVNDAPTFTPGADQTVDEDSGAASIANWATSISAGPADESAQALTFFVTNDNNALFSAQPAVAADGTLTFTPATNANGSATVTVILADNGGTANGGDDTASTITFTITVRSVNDVPSFTKGSDEAVLEDSSAHTVPNWATNISAGPTNESAQTLTFNVTNDNNGLFAVQPAIAADGTLTYTLAANAFGTAVVTVTLSDNGGTANGGVDTSAAQTFNIVVGAVNDAPSYTIGADQNLFEDDPAQTIANWATNISAGPANESAQALTFTVTGNSNPGLFSAGPAIAADGTLTYTLAPNANGTADIIIVLSDNGGTANGGVDATAPLTFHITAQAVNDAPTFNKGPDQTVLDDVPPQTIVGWATGITAGPADEAGQTLTFNVIGNTNPGLFSAGPAIAADGTLTYTLVPNSDGFADITITLSDNGGTANGGVDTSAPQIFRISVNLRNDAPSFDKGPDQTALEDSGAHSVANWAKNILAGPANESGQTVTFNVTDNTNAALFSVAPAIAADGTLTYTLAANANGFADITVVLKDDGGTANGGVDTSAPQTFRISVTAVNDAPSFTKGADQSVLEDAGTVTVVGWATGISAGPADEATQLLTFTLTGNTNLGLFSVQPAIAADGTLTYTLAANANGSADVTFTLSDDGGIANGGADTSAPQTFHITVASVNDRPTFTGGADQSVLEDAGAQTVVNWATAISKGPANESSQTLNFLVSNDNNALFSVQPAISATGTLTYTPASNANGSTTVTVILQDSGGTANGGVNTSTAYTFTISVQAVNDAPSFTPGADQTVDEDAGAVTVAGWATNISAGPADEGGQALTFQVTNNNNSLFSVQPAIDANGTLTYTPAANFFGTATVTVVLTDDGGTANGGANSSGSITFTITVNSVNDAPSFTKGADETVLEDSGAHSVDPWATSLSAGPTNEAAQTLTFNVTNDNNALFAVQPSIDATGKLTYTLAADAFGTATVTVTLSDNGGTANGGVDTSAPQTFTINVTPVNDAPSFVKGPDQNVLDDVPPQSIAGWATSITAGPANESTQTLTFNVINNTNPALFASGPAIAADGTLTYTLVPDADGFADITITLSDDGGTANGGVDTSASQTFRIVVTLVNDAPSFTVGPDQTVLEDAGAQTVLNWATDISAGPANEAGQILTFNVTGNTNPSLFSAAPAISANGTLTYTAAPDAFGFADITINLKDNGGTINGGVDTSVSKTFRITVTPINDRPTFTGGADQINLEDSGAHSIPNWATNISTGAANESQVLTFLVNNDNNSLFSSQPAISANGTLTYTLAPNANGTTTVTVVLQDDGGVSNGGIDTSTAYQFTITVLSVNDAPTFTKGPDQTVDEDAGDITVVGWATNISAGPAQEAGQTLTFLVSNNNNALFSTQPAIATDGTLTFTPAADAFGTATVTVVLSDNGGTANGGNNSTTSVTFTITVVSVNDAPTFTPGGDENVLEDSGAHTVNGWATNISAGPANEAAQTLTFNVTNDNNALFSVQPAIDATGKLTYTLAADAFGTATVTVTLSDNGGTANGGVDTSATETFTINVDSINDVPTYIIGANQNVLEDDPPQSIPGWATNITAGAANESSQVLTFNVTNNTNPGLFSVAPAIAADGTLTYTLAPDAFGFADITITLSDDGGTANGGVDTTAPKTFRITAASVNDAPTFTAGPNVSVPENAPAQTIPNWATNISAGPANEASQTLTFIVTNDNNILFSVQPAIAADGTLTFTPTSSAFGLATVTVTLMDNGGTANGGVDTSTEITFTITVGEVNDPPTFTKGPDETVLEDSGTHTVPNWATNISAGPANEAGQTLTFTTTNNNNALFSVQPTVALNGTLTYTLAADAFGVATVTVTLSDDGGTANGGIDSTTRTFTITVLAVNDVPTFNKGPDQNVLEDAIPQVVPNWATGITRGPANEAGQTLTFNVVNNSNPSLFSVAPAISATGTLTYTLAPNANGFADITITLSDNGGTANGGVDTTAPQMFRINVGAVNDRPTFVVGPNQTALEDAPPQTVVGFATSISAGPADEASQTVSFLVTNNNNGLFSVQPAIAPNGTLTYTLAANAVGSATVTVILQDNGGTANGGFNTSISQVFTISVTPVNDPPLFTQGPNQTVLEDAGTTTVVGWATGIAAGPADESGQSVTFQVTNNNNPLFLVQPAIAANGTLTFTPAPNANGTATVTVVLQDNGGIANGGSNTSSSITFTINVTAVNDAPSFVKGSDQTVFEDAGAQSVLNWATSISAGPADEAGQTLTFVVSNNNNGLFSVQPSISANGTLTYTPAANANGSATVTVTLQDNGGTANGGSNVSVTQTFVINVTAVDDPPTDLSLSNTTLPENQPIGTTVGTFTTTDPDTGDTFTYTLVAGTGSDDNGSFTISGNQLRTNTALDFETKSSYTVRVRTTSNGGAFFEKSFVVTVTNVNEVPTDITLSNSTVAENQPVNTTVGTFAAVDSDAGDTFSFLLVNGAGSTDNASFKIVGNVLQTNAVLDFEAQPSYSIRVRTTDAGGLTFEKIFLITATNVDEAPVDVGLTNSSVPENQPIGTLVGNFVTTDQDAGDTFSYVLVGGVGSADNAKFQVVGTSLQTNAVLDFETQVTYSIRVRVTDSGGLTFEKALTISATNVNETPADLAVAPSTVAENQPAGTFVGNFTATDPDAGDTFTFSLVGGAGSTDNALFQVVGGVLQTNAVLNFEAQPTYSVRVRVTDAGGLSFEKVVTITATNVNEAPTDLALSSTSLPENQPIGTTVGSFTSTDADAGDTFTYALVTGAGSTDNARFQIFGNTLQTASVLDFEAQSTYSIRVRTTDAGGLVFEKTFIITATNVQEVPTDVALSNNTVAENQPVGTTVGTLSSTDQDVGDTFTYTLVPGVGSTDNASFQIVGNVLQTNATFNFEQQTAYSIRIQTTDSSGQSFERSFTINITNVNEAPTDLALGVNTVAENQPVGTPIGNFTTTDPDAGGTFTYALVPGVGGTDNGFFQIVNGTLRTNASLNFEAQNTYSIRVRTTDAGGLSFEKSFTINVTDVNEAPTNIALSSNTVAENQPVGTNIGTLTTTDQDTGDSFTYTLVSGAGSIDNASFKIVGDTLQTNAVLNFEAQPSYSIRIRTTDALGLTFEKTFTIVATNVNEAPTNISLSPNVLPESQPIGTVVGNLTTTDPDTGDTFTYSLVPGVGGTDNALFQISGGVVQTNAVLNFEAQASYSIRVRSTDAGGLSVEKTLLISVTNVNEAPTAINLSSTSVPENQPVNTVVGVLSSNDPDFGDVVTFSLVGGAGATDNAQFQVVGNVLRTSAVFNFETQSTYSIRVRAVDSANHVFEQALTIQITNVNEAPTNLALSNNTVAENQPIGTTVGTFSSADPDQGDTFTYSLVAGLGSVDNGSFQIVGNTLLTNASLNFEAQPTYSIRVRTTDANGLTFERSFTISATNVNESPVAIGLSATAVAENRDPGTVVAQLTTTDPDAGNTFTYTLVSGAGSSGNAAFTIVGNQLQTAVTLDFETQPSYSIRVRSTDNGGLSVEQVFTITVSDELDPPVVTTTAGQTTSASPKDVIIDSGVTLQDQDTTDFNGGRIEVTVVEGVQNPDQLRIIKNGKGPDRLHVAGGKLKLGKQVIGTVTGGKVGIPLQVFFTANTPISLAERVLKSVGLRTKANHPGSRIVQFKAVDGDGQISQPATKEVVIG